MNGKDIAGENGEFPYAIPVPEGFELPSALNIKAGLNDMSKAIIIAYSIKAITHLGMMTIMSTTYITPYEEKKTIPSVSVSARVLASETSVAC